MTYTIIGRCRRTRQLGIGITTWSLGVGGYCPFVKSNVAALSSQAAADPRLGRLAMRLLEFGYSPARVIQELRSTDPHFEHRQIGIVDKDGNAVVHTGTSTRPWTGHLTGDGYASMGNTSDSEKVVQAMARVFEETEDLDLVSRPRSTLAKAFDAFKNVVSRLGPDERLWRLIGDVEVAVDGGLQVTDTEVHAAPQLLFGQ